MPRFKNIKDKFGVPEQEVSSLGVGLPPKSLDPVLEQQEEGSYVEPSPDSNEQLQQYFRDRLAREQAENSMHDIQSADRQELMAPFAAPSKMAPAPNPKNKMLLDVLDTFRRRN